MLIFVGIEPINYQKAVGNARGVYELAHFRDKLHHKARFHYGFTQEVPVFTFLLKPVE